MTAKNVIMALVFIMTTASLSMSCMGGDKNKSNSTETVETSGFDKIINGKTPVIVDFYADWCAPCKIQDPILEELKADLGDGVIVYKVNVDYEKDLANRYAVQSIPTIMVFKEGQMLWKAVGVQSIDVLKEVVNKVK